MKIKENYTNLIIYLASSLDSPSFGSLDSPSFLSSPPFLSLSSFFFFFFFFSFSFSFVSPFATASKSSTNSGASSILSFSLSLFLRSSEASLTKASCLGPSCFKREVNTSLRFLVSWTPETKLTFSLNEYSIVGFLNWITVLSSLKMFTSIISFNLRA